MTRATGRHTRNASIPHQTSVAHQLSMEAVGLRYLTEYQVLVCLEHQRGIIPTGVKTHLRKEHRAKGTELTTALEEVDRLRPPPLAASDLPTVAHGSAYIPEILAVEAYHCVLERCNGESASLSESRLTVERHQARVHGVNHGRKLGGRTKPGSSASYYNIATVKIQSLLPQPYRRPYIIKENTERLREYSEPQSSIVVLAQIDKDLETAKECDRTLYGRVPEEATQAQLPPWLVRTGISNHLSGMAKETVNTLVGIATHGMAIIL